ncbi:RadC family protein [Sphingosinicella microcystinivorans]|uniref:RadC family protein n=1 Tax=Sphingosinicella microcystinivorans TaxID=335406 RepID=UPI0022F39BBB|nr:DNA repair protein RadC [Sphingosinicella microcystinivorans]WBX85288.1 DNA repair protein RadC [Sphingosinicella microcystinivorans]
MADTDSDSGADAGHRARMRTRMLQGGGDAFHDYELLEYVLGLAIPRRDTKPLAKVLIARFQSFAAVIAAEPRDLKRVPGVGDTVIATLGFVRAAALRLQRANIYGKPVLAGWQALLDYLHADMAHLGRERFRVLFLDSRNVLIADEAMSDGTVNQTSVYVREVIHRALDLGATALILVHNHPSGDPKPSRDDIQLTNHIRDAARVLGVQLHDHIVIGREGHASFKALGLL